MRRFLFLGLFLLACSNGSPAAPPPDPAVELKQAGQAMGTVKSVTADVKFGSGVDYQGFTLTSATARIQPPSTSDTTLKVKQQDFLVDIQVITLPGHVYVKVPFSAFTELTPQQAGELPNLGGLFDPQSGLPAALPNGTATHRLGSEKVGGVDCDKIATTYSAQTLGSALGGLKPAGDVAATIWVSRADHLVRRVVLNGQVVPSAGATTVQVDLHDFNAPVSVTPPPVSATPTPSPSS